MPKGLYRRRTAHPKTGKLRHTGAYVREIHLPDVPEFAGMKRRFVRTTGLRPGDKNAEVIVAEMKRMIKELIRERDKGTLRKIEKNSMSLLSLHKWWLEGRVHLAREYEKFRVVEEWLRYYDESGHSAKTRVNRRAVVASLEAKGFLTDETVVNDLPGILAKIRKHYDAKKQSPAFNTIRIEMIAFLTKGLGMEKDSAFVRELDRVEPLPQGERREPHPLENPRDCADLCAQILKRPTPAAGLYAESVLFMCKHGLRPEEFEGKRFEIDPTTEHLRITGTKNKNAKRVAPLSSSFLQEKPPKIATLNMMFARMGSPVRCRDFRRTFAIWCESAGIPQARITAYLGHGAKTMTQRYQLNTPKQATLDLDRDQLQRWYDAELEKVPAARKKVTPRSTFRDLVQAVRPSLTKLKAAAAKQAESDRRNKRKWED